MTQHTEFSDTKPPLSPRLSPRPEASTSLAAGWWPWPAHAAALILAPLLLIMSDILDSTSPADGVGDYLRRVAVSPGTYLAAGFALAFGFMLLVPVACAFFRFAADRPRTQLVRVGAVLLGAGGVMGLMPVTLSYGAGYLLGSGAFPLASPTIVEASFTGLNGSPLALVGGVGSAIGQGLGCIFVAVGLWRSRAITRWAAPLPLALPLSWVVFGALGLSLPWGVLIVPSVLLGVTFCVVAVRGAPRSR